MYLDAKVFQIQQKILFSTIIRSIWYRKLNLFLLVILYNIVIRSGFQYFARVKFRDFEAFFFLFELFK
jgi:hypothetical protein